MATRKQKKAPKVRTRKATLAEYEAAIDALGALPPSDVAEVICGMLNMARAKFGEPEPGALTAAHAAVRAMFGCAEDPALAARLAAVGRGVRVRSTSKDAAPAIRQLAKIVDYARDHVVGDHQDQARGVARMARRDLGAQGSVEAIATALARRTRNGRVAGVAAALRIVSEGQAGLDVVRRALES